jgi:hypothetical protein
LNFESHAILQDVRGGMQREPAGALSSSFSHSARHASSAVALVVVAVAHLPSGIDGAFGVGSDDAVVTGALLDEGAGDEAGSFAGAELPPQAARTSAEEKRRAVRMRSL